MLIRRRDKHRMIRKLKDLMQSFKDNGKDKIMKKERVNDRSNHLERFHPFTSSLTGN